MTNFSVAEYLRSRKNYTEKTLQSSIERYEILNNEMLELEKSIEYYKEEINKLDEAVLVLEDLY